MTWQRRRTARIAGCATLALAVAIWAAVAYPRSAPAADDEPVVPGRVVVKFRVGAMARSAQAAYGAFAVEERPALGAQVWRVQPGREREVARQLAARLDVQYAEPARPRYLLAIPN